LKQTQFIALRLTHPTIAPAAISQHVGLVPKYSWAVGEKRQTPKGTPLSGIRKETYCCFDLPVRRRSLSDAVERILTHDLASQKRFFRKFAATGGTIQLYVSWGTGTTDGDVFPWTTLKRMADLRIDLAVEWFAVPQESRLPKPTKSQSPVPLVPPERGS
jgi:hypothetical protein